MGVALAKSEINTIKNLDKQKSSLYNNVIKTNQDKFNNKISSFKDG